METKPSLIPSWRESLSQRLACFNDRPRLAVLGIGNELYGDDAAGVIAARRLQAALGGRGSVLVLDTGGVPENATGALRRFQPEMVLLVDAALMDADAGTLRCLSWRDMVGLDASTHTFPLSTLAEYLSNELACEVCLVGIQPQGDDLDAPLSPPVQAAVDTLVQTLVDLLQ